MITVPMTTTEAAKVRTAIDLVRQASPSVFEALADVQHRIGDHLAGTAPLDGYVLISRADAQAASRYVNQANGPIDLALRLDVDL